MIQFDLYLCLLEFIKLSTTFVDVGVDIGVEVIDGFNIKFITFIINCSLLLSSISMLLEKVIEPAEKNGARLVVKPVIGFENRLISFLYLNMKNTNCNLIELVTSK